MRITLVVLLCLLFQRNSHQADVVSATIPSETNHFNIQEATTLPTDAIQTVQLQEGPEPTANPDAPKIKRCSRHNVLLGDQPEIVTLKLNRRDVSDERRLQQCQKCRNGKLCKQMKICTTCNIYCDPLPAAPMIESRFNDDSRQDRIVQAEASKKPQYRYFTIGDTSQKTTMGLLSRIFNVGNKNYDRFIVLGAKKNTYGEKVPFLLDSAKAFSDDKLTPPGIYQLGAFNGEELTKAIQDGLAAKLVETNGNGLIIPQINEVLDNVLTEFTNPNVEAKERCASIEDLEETAAEIMNMGRQNQPQASSEVEEGPSSNPEGINSGLVGKEPEEELIDDNGEAKPAMGNDQGISQKTFDIVPTDRNLVGEPVIPEEVPTNGNLVGEPVIPEEVPTNENLVGEPVNPEEEPTNGNLVGKPVEPEKVPILEEVPQGPPPEAGNLVQEPEMKRRIGSSEENQSSASSSEEKIGLKKSSNNLDNSDSSNSSSDEKVKQQQFEKNNLKNDIISIVEDSLKVASNENNLESQTNLQAENPTSEVQPPNANINLDDMMNQVRKIPDIVTNIAEDATKQAEEINKQAQQFRNPIVVPPLVSEPLQEGNLAQINNPNIEMAPTLQEEEPEANQALQESVPNLINRFPEDQTKPELETAPTLQEEEPETNQALQNAPTLQEEKPEPNQALQESVPNLINRFPEDQTASSNNFGDLVPSEQKANSPIKNFYFVGKDINLPLQMVANKDGVMHLTVDMEKLCHCGKKNCTRRHVSSEELIETNQGPFHLVPVKRNSGKTRFSRHDLVDQLQPELVEDEPEVGIKEEPEVGIEKEPDVEIEEEPEVGIPEKPEVGIEEEPELGIREKPQVGLNEPEAEIEEEPELSLEEEREAMIEEPEASLVAKRSITSGENFADLGNEEFDDLVPVDGSYQFQQFENQIADDLERLEEISANLRKYNRKNLNLVNKGTVALLRGGREAREADKMVHIAGNLITWMKSLKHE